MIQFIINFIRRFTPGSKSVQSQPQTRADRRRQLMLVRKEQKRKSTVQFYCPIGQHEYTIPGAPYLPPFVKPCESCHA